MLRRVVELGLTHIDTSDYYGPYTVNEVIREALHPYPDDLVLVTKVGARREPDKSWPAARSRDELIQAVHDNIDHLGVEAIDVVNLRMTGPGGGPGGGSVAEPFGVLAELQQQGLIRHLGVSNVTAEQVEEARSIAPIVCVQNHYNLAHREDDDLVDLCAERGHRLHQLLPARRVLAVAVRGARRRRGTTGRDPPPGGPGLAAAALPHDAADPRHVLAGAPPRQRRRRRGWSCPPMPWRSWTPSLVRPPRPVFSRRRGGATSVLPSGRQGEAR